MYRFVQKIRQRSEDESSSTQHWMQVMHWVWAHFVIGGSIVFGFGLVAFECSIVEPLCLYTMPTEPVSRLFSSVEVLEPSRKHKKELGATTWGVTLEKSKKCGPWLSLESMLFAFINDNINAYINAYKCFNTKAYTWIKCPLFNWERC